MIKKLCISFAFLFGCAHASPLNQSLPNQVTDCAGSQCVAVYHLNGEVNSDMKDEVTAWIKEVNERNVKAILIEMNTPGGSIPDGFDIAKSIETSKAPVTCVVDGEADSMGAYILQSCKTRLMTHRSMIMFHEPSLSGKMSGNPNEWQAVANWLNAMREAVAQHCNHRLTTTMAEYHKRTDGGLMWWLAAPDAIRFHAVDRVVPSVAAAIAYLR